MRDAARQPRDDPAPERADLDAKAVQVLDGQLEFVSRATALLDCSADPHLLRQMITEVISWGLHCEELRSEMARYTAANAGNGHMLAALMAREHKTQDAPPPIPRQGHRAAGKWTQNPILRRVKVVAFIALLGSGLRTAGRAHRLAAALAAVTIPFAAGAGTYAALQPGVTSTASPPAASAPVPGWHTSATPVPSQSLAALTRPKPKHAGKGKTLLAAGGLLPVYSTAPQAAPSSAPSSAAPAVSVAVGPAQLSVSAATLDLSLVPQATFTVSASGSGWASWHVSTSGTDLAFSPSSGVLQAGQSVTVTVSLASALDGLAQQSFSIAGETIAVTLPLPVPLPSPTDVVPTDVLPSGVLPSGT